MDDSVEMEIRRTGKPPTLFRAAPGVYTVGSDEDCSISLADAEVDGRHAVLTLRDGRCWIEDLDSSTGTYVDASRIEGRVEVAPGQRIGVGPFALVSEGLPAGQDEGSTTPGTEGGAGDVDTPDTRMGEPDGAPPPGALGSAEGPADPFDQKRSVKMQIHRELVERLDIKRLTAARIKDDQLRKTALRAIRNIVDEVRDRLPAGLSPDRVAREVFDEALGLGPLEELLADPDVTEIMVNGHRHIYVEKAGKLLRTDQTFMDDNSVLATIERIVSRLGRRIDESQPYVDARLPDGSRVNAIIPPLSLVGPCLTIRKFAANPFTDEDLIRFGTFPATFADFLRVCVRLRKNIVVSGGTGSGKTTLLNVLSGYLPESERIVTIEDAAELRLKQAHVVRLEARPPNIEGKGAVTIRDLVRNCLRMRPDRIVVGECRGGEALDMLQAMNTGHDGSLTTVHANSPRDVISRLETMALMSGLELPVRAIREQVAAAIDLIVHEARLGDGTRKITCISEVVGLEGEHITLQDIFTFRQTGVDDTGRVLGRFVPTGGVPTFMEEVQAHGLSIERAMFDPQHGAL